jgi:hypothetical protein
MLEEVATYGHLVGVGGPVLDTELPLKVPILEFTKDNFDPTLPAKRPDGWVAARKKRVHKKEQLDRLRGVPNHIIEERRRQREIDVRIIFPTFSFIITKNYDISNMWYTGGEVNVGRGCKAWTFGRYWRTTEDC